MPEPGNDLLTDPVLRVRTADGAVLRWSLPEILAGLESGVEMEFPGLRAHHQHAWHAFLCQLAAGALHRGGVRFQESRTPEAWQRLLVDLTNGDHRPWCLVVDDLSAPAFFQPPVPEGSLSGFGNETYYPDILDTLFTRRNHDVKCQRIQASEGEDWIFALINLQTTDGYAGKFNYGIVRMNSGTGSRTCVSVAREDKWPIRFNRDTAILLEARPTIVTAHGFSERTGTLLQWIIPWDGKMQVALQELDPFFLEICRRVRLAPRNGQIAARYTGSAERRTNAGDTKGNLGDPWIPIRREDGAALTPKSLNYALLQGVLFGGDFSPSLSSVVQNMDGEEPLIIARVLVREQGKTLGYQERIIPCPKRARKFFADPEGRRRIGSLSKERVEMAATARRKVLKPALATLRQGGPDKVNFDDPQADRFVERLDQNIDAIFFQFLFRDIDASADEAKERWSRVLTSFCRSIFQDAVASMTIPSQRRYKAIAAGEAALYRALRKNFPDSTFAYHEEHGS